MKDAAQVTRDVEEESRSDKGDWSVLVTCYIMYDETGSYYNPTAFFFIFRNHLAPDNGHLAIASSRHEMSKPPSRTGEGAVVDPLR